MKRATGMTISRIDRVQKHDQSLPTRVPVQKGGQAERDGAQLEGRLAIRLDRNELPRRPDGSVTHAATSEVCTSNLYPSPDSRPLRVALAATCQVEPENIVVASGSISVIRQAMLVAGAGELLLTAPGFEAFQDLCEAFDMRARSTSPSFDGGADLRKIRSLVSDSTRMIILCTPHSPTGGILRHREVEEFLKDLPAHILVLIDEAYWEFVEDHEAVRSIELARADSRVVVTRTFSKAYGLAGLRVGYGVAQSGLARLITRVGVPYSISSVGEAAALAALRQPRKLRDNVRRINSERRRLTRGLRALGVDAAGGHGNFVWLPMRGDQAQVLARGLARGGIIVKRYPGHGLRITVGSPEQNDQVLQRMSRLATGLTACP